LDAEISSVQDWTQERKLDSQIRTSGLRTMKWPYSTLRASRGFFCFCFCCIFAASTASTSAASKQSEPDRNTIARNLDVLPLSFETNQGQSSSDAKFLAHGRGFSALFKPNKADLVLTHRNGTHDSICVTLPDASRRASISGESRLPGTVNYFSGADPRNWHTGLATFKRLRYRGVYPGIDLIYYGSQGRLEFDFELAPGADLNAVHMRFDGSRTVKIDRVGDLVVGGKSGEIKFEKPVIYQPTASGGKDLVAGSFEALGKKTIGFAVAAYDPTRPLIIDPILNYSTYIGDGIAEATSIAVDQSGEAYITGWADLYFPTTPGSYQPVPVQSSAGAFYPLGGRPFVAKFNSAGTALLYATYLTGSGEDFVHGIALDANGDAFVVGTTSSTNFPITPGALQTTNNASQATGFVTELNSTGSALLYSTYLGGSTSSAVNGVTIDGTGNAYVTGSTQDANFPTTPGAYQTAQPPKPNGGLPPPEPFTSAFIAKFNPAGTLAYSTYLGGNQTDAGSAIAVDAAGEAYVGGDTTSGNFPITAGADQPTRGIINAQSGFITKFNASGSALVYSTYLCGDDIDNLVAIAVDSNGDAYVTGSTNSTNFPVTPGAFQSAIGISSFGYPQINAFFTELNSTGTALVYSTFLGGGVSLGPDADEGDEATGIAVDGQGMAYVTGRACTGDYPVTAGALEPRNLDGEIDGECTAFLTKVNPAPNKPLVYSTFLGGTGDGDAGDDFYGEGGGGLALDSSGNVYAAGFTRSVDFPVTPGVVETPFTGPAAKAFVTEFNGSEMTTLPIPTLTLTSSTSSVFVGQPVTFTATVQPASSNSTPTGYVAFNFLQVEPADDEGLGVGFGPWSIVGLNGSGVATFTTSALQALQTPVNAFYLGDANNASASATITQTVSDIPTTTTVTASANNVPYGTPVVFTATVFDNSGNPMEGLVSFGVEGGSYAAPTLNSAGQATWTNGSGGSTLPVGVDTVEADYFLPTQGYQKSSGTVVVTFTSLGTTPTPTLTPPAGTYTSVQQVTLGDSNAASIVYYTTDGSTPVPGISADLPAGFTITVRASETINALAVAPGYTASNMVSAAYIINLPAPDFTLSLTSQAITVPVGMNAATQVNINGLNGFVQSVSLSCSGLPAGVTCAFAPSSVTGTGGSILTITASASASVNTRPANSPFVPLTALAAAIGCICIRRRRIGLPILLACILSLIALTGCGGGGSSSASGSTPAVSTVSVIGTSGSLSHSASLSLTLTQ
jgi:hypothetical protein